MKKTKTKSGPKIKQKVTEKTENHAASHQTNGDQNGRVYALRKEIRPDPDQPRKEFPEQDLLELAENISANGIVENLLVRPDPEKKTKFMLVDGERRFRASGLVKIDRLPIEIRPMSNEEARKYQRISGTQRENLTALEEAADLAQELTARQAKDPKFTPELLGKELGIKRGTIYNRLKLTRLHAALRLALTEGKIDVMVAAEASRIPDPAVQAIFVKEVTNTEDRRYPFSYRAVQELIEEKYVKPLSAAPFDPEDALMLPKCGACSACPKLSGNMRALFPEIKNGKICTDLNCFQGKVEAHNARVVTAAKEGGQTVLSEKECQGIFYGPEYGSRAGDLSYSADYIDLKEDCEVMEHGSRKPWRAVLGKECPAAVIAVDRLGGLHELLKKSVAMEALKKTGWKPREGSSSNGMSPAAKAAQKARDKKKKLYVATLTAAIPGILERLVTDGVPHLKLWPLLAEAAYGALSIESHDFIAKRMGISKKVSESRDALNRWFKEPNHSTNDYVRFVVEILLLSRPIGGGYQKVEWDDETLLVAKLGGADLEKLVKNSQPELSEAKKSGGGQNKSETEEVNPNL